ncbi:HAD-IIB family hydrolase [Aureimonas frigidaquae]|uniref:sucrose-phosphate synthase n=1 Tax=Aureimonas frigidaquae TaxID=424757 RepID=A0A0P0Z4M2_9HYPH|nr:HAD-IIB family hydrolase [Aureimonas frigidaquae]BAT28821.1 HAD-superfamily hydrolase [Aureimonas frigidaquae]
MFVLHVALQGCLKGCDVQYGLTADTGGHIRYLLDLVEAAAELHPTHRHVIATRLFDGMGEAYTRTVEPCRPGVEIIRIASANPAYLPKEDIHTEVASFAENLIAHIEAGARPDVIHAHYADAAQVAAIVRRRLGIPFVFTAHSLGRVKQAMLDGTGDMTGMAQRIAAEELALSQASLLIASSRDEAEVQYALYDAYDPGRIRVLPPGSNLSAFRNAVPSARIEAELARFLRQPDKPCILAIARPVRRKNLTALIEAYGRNAALRDKANLILVAGTRDDIETLDGEMSSVMEDMLRLIDRYDLYGQVAYPKHHCPQDVPGYYAYARARCGVFVNPALNEPFGLTLLEASAASLPLVATDSGGPNDIIETCGNGVLVDPRNPDDIGRAALRIIADERLWNRLSRAGDAAAAAYDWGRHARRYTGLLNGLRQPAALQPTRPNKLLVCDIDNTLVGCGEGIRAFRDWRPSQSGLSFGVATGRSFHSAMAILEREDMPRPQFLITSVGSEIYHLDANGVTYNSDRAWQRRVARSWEPDKAMACLSNVEGIIPQAPLEQRPFKLSYFSDGRSATAAQVRVRLQKAGIEASVIHSHGRYLDVLPSGVSKGSAVDFVRRLLRLPIEAVIVAGDSGNDVEMLRSVPQSIIVANHSDDLPNLPALRHSYVSHDTHARGVIEGVAHFQMLAGVPCKAAS